MHNLFLKFFHQPRNYFDIQFCKVTCDQGFDWVNMEEFKNILSFSENHLSTNSLTYSIIYQNDLTSDFNWDLISEKPRVLNISLKMRESIQLAPGFTRILFILLLASKTFILEPPDFLSKGFHPSKDDLILWGEEKHVLQIIKSNWFLKLGFKMTYSFDTKLIRVNSRVWGNGNMNKISKISEKNDWGNFKMGYLLRGRHLRGVCFEGKPMHFKRVVKGRDEIDGSTVKVVQDFASHFNFTLSGDIVPYGKRYDNGTLDGYLGHLANPNSPYDIGFIAAYLYPRFGTADWPSYGQVIFRNRFAFAVKQGNPVFRWYAFLEPLQPSVWLACVLMFLAFSLAQSYTMYRFKCEGVYKPIVFDAATIFPLGLLLEQGVQDIPRGMKFFALLLLLATTVIGTGYKSMLRKNLSFPRQEQVPESFEELAQATNYKIIFVNLGFERQNSKDNPLFKQIESRIKFVPRGELDSIRNDLLHEEKFVLIYWDQFFKEIIFQNLMFDDHVQFQYSQDELMSIMIGFGMKRQSIFTESFTLLAYAGIECGLYAKSVEITNYELKNKRKNGKATDNILSENNNDISDECSDNERQLTLHNVRIVLLIPILGGLLGLVAYLGEIFYFKSLSKK